MIHRKHQLTTQSSQSGFTIIESLVAILVVATLLTAIAPVIVLSVATRVQAKRIETAADAAKSYIEGVRSGTIVAPPVIPTPPTDCSSKDDKKAVIACQPVPPTGTLTCTAVSTIAPNYCNSPTTNSYCPPSSTACSTNLYCVNLDSSACTNNNSKNFIIQAFRYNQVSTATDSQGYLLGVRVYRASGFSSEGGNLKKAPSKQPTFTGGAGDRKAPLVEMTTEISKTGTKNATFSDFCDRLKQTNPQSTCS